MRQSQLSFLEVEVFFHHVHKCQLIRNSDQQKWKEYFAFGEQFVIVYTLVPSNFSRNNIVPGFQLLVQKCYCARVITFYWEIIYFLQLWKLPAVHRELKTVPLENKKHLTLIIISTLLYMLTVNLKCFYFIKIWNFRGITRVHFSIL